MTPVKGAARRLRRLAGALLAVSSVVFGVAAVVGVALAALTHDKSTRITGGAMAGGAVLAWLLVAVLCAAAETFSWYVEAKVSSRAG